MSDRQFGRLDVHDTFAFMMIMTDHEHIMNLIVNNHDALLSCFLPCDQLTSIMKLIIHLTINHDFDDILLDGLQDDKMMSSRLRAASNMIKLTPYS